MLIGMNLALAAGHTTPAFNSVFYATVATVIPILFLAIAVQGETVSELLRLSATRLDAYRNAVAHAGANGRPGKSFASQFLDSAPVNIAAGIIVYGTACEIGAIVALLVQGAPEVIGILIAIGTIFIVLAAALGPATRLITFLVEQERKDNAAKRERAAAQAATPELPDND
jgi:hypothetical protein